MLNIPTSFCHAEDLAPLFSELDTQADAVLASVSVLRNVHGKYAKSTDEVGKGEFIVVLREHGTALETDLGIIKLNAELITDERIEAWMNETTSTAERAARKSLLAALTTKMRNLEEAMVRLRSDMVDVENGSS